MNCDKPGTKEGSVLPATDHQAEERIAPILATEEGETIHDAPREAR